LAIDDHALQNDIELIADRLHRQFATACPTI